MYDLPSISRNSVGRVDRDFLYVYQNYDAYFYPDIAEHTGWRTECLIGYGTALDDVRVCNGVACGVAAYIDVDMNNMADNTGAD